MTEEQRKIHDNALWWESVERRKKSLERWSKSPLSPEEAWEQARRLALTLPMTSDSCSRV
jgi:hypothetical protein